MWQEADTATDDGKSHSSRTTPGGAQGLCYASGAVAMKLVDRDRTTTTVDREYATMVDTSLIKEMLAQAASELQRDDSLLGSKHSGNGRHSGGSGKHSSGGKHSSSPHRRKSSPPRRGKRSGGSKSSPPSRKSSPPSRHPRSGRGEGQGEGRGEGRGEWRGEAQGEGRGEAQGEGRMSNLEGGRHRTKVSGRAAERRVGHEPLDESGRIQGSREVQSGQARSSRHRRPAETSEAHQRKANHQRTRKEAPGGRSERHTGGDAPEGDGDGGGVANAVAHEGGDAALGDDGLLAIQPAPQINEFDAIYDQINFGEDGARGPDDEARKLMC